MTLTSSSWLTVAIPTLNAAGTLARTLNSLVAQSWPERDPRRSGVDYLVVDGGSIDGTLSIVADYARRLPIRIERDTGRGIYGALNDALRASSSDYFAWLNADDYYLPWTLASVADAAKDEPDIISGSALVTDLCGDDTYYDVQLYGRLSPFNLCFGAPIPNARFYSRDAVSSIGGFDSSYRISGDREWLWRFHDRARPLTTRWVRACVYVYVAHSGSLTFSGQINRDAVREYRQLSALLLARASRGAHERIVLESWRAWNDRVLGKAASSWGHLSSAVALKALARMRRGISTRRRPADLEFAPPWN